MEFKKMILVFLGVTIGAAVLGLILHEYICGAVFLIGLIVTVLGVFGLLFHREFFLLGIGVVILVSGFLAFMLMYGIWDLIPGWQPLLHR